jgi:GT2 family glycosyltransferase
MNSDRFKFKFKKYETLKPFIYFYSFYKNKIHHHNNFKNLKKKYAVSIVMPTYNRKKIISEAIDSVLNQTFPNFELIIVDDGSDDGTEEFIKNKYGNYLKNGVIKYFRLNHEGVCAARNHGLSKVSGNIIAYLDSDNQWDPRYLEIMVNALDKNGNSNCAYCGVKVNQNVRKITFVRNKKYNRKKLLRLNFIDLNCFVHEKVLYDQYGGFDEDLTRLVDWDLIIRYTKDNDPVHVKDVLVNYIIDGSLDNITMTVPLTNNMDKIHEKYWKELYQKEYEIVKDDFDEDYYVSQYGDEISDELTPLHHFLSVGYKEGKNPNPDFVTSFYKNTYKDVKKTNPFVHYLTKGQGRKINYFDEKNRIINTNAALLTNYEFDNEPLVSIIILNKDGLHHLKRLFDDFENKTNYSNFEIIVVDNASEDSSVDYLKSLSLDIKIIENKENVSFAKGNNDAVKLSNGEYVLLLNNDIEPTYGWLNEMMGTMIYSSNAGSVGAKLIYPYIENSKNTHKSFTIQHAGDILREEKDDVCLYKGHNQNKFSKDIFDSDISINKKRLLVTGAVLLVKKSVYMEVGGLDEGYWYGYEDIDFNLRVNKLGYDTIFASSALLFHHESATRKVIDRNNHKLFCQKWSDYLFKKLLRDKIEKNFFFTDKKLEFLLVKDSDASHYDECIHNFTKFCVNNGYNIDLNVDMLDFDIDSNTDILISFTTDYEIGNINARKNIIKVLVLSENDLNEDFDLSGYDILIADGYLKSDNVYVSDDFNNLGEELIEILYDKYLD